MPDLQHAPASEPQMNWSTTTIAPDGTHHLLDGQPFYAARFCRVHKYHDPGLAPVVDDTGAYHIDPHGRPAYAARFRQTWGFYEGLAAVEADDGWHHILPDGAPLSAYRFDWCGNFQERRCTVRQRDSRYLHLDATGEPAYPERHGYAGDFCDGAAVVRSLENDLCTHITPEGSRLHGQCFLDLAVFHKGYARARDARGWFHVDRHGVQAYSVRFADVEPFYNGTALAQTVSDERVLIDPTGREVLAITQNPHPPSTTAASLQVVVIGNIGAGKTEVAGFLAKRLGWPMVAIDTMRRRVGDGSPAGELRAWSKFVSCAQASRPKVLECSGSGPMVHLLARALAESRASVLVLWVDAPVDACLTRIRNRDWDTPYPDFGVPIESVVRDLGQRLSSELAGGRAWSRFDVHRLDAGVTRDAVCEQAWQVVQKRVGGFPS